MLMNNFYQSIRHIQINQYPEKFLEPPPTPHTNIIKNNNSHHEGSFFSSFPLSLNKKKSQESHRQINNQFL